MTISTAAFGRALRRLDASESREFVADLLAARGYRTTVDGRVVTAESETGRSTRLLVVAGGRSLAAAGAAAAVDTVVTTGGPVATAVGALLVRVAGRREDPPARIGPETLREWLVFAVDEDDRAALIDRYLGATEPTAVGRVAGAIAGGLSSLAGGAGSAQRPSRRVAAAVLVAVVAVAAAVAAGPLVSIAPTGPVPGDGGPGTAGGPATATVTTTGAATEVRTPEAPTPQVPASTDAGAILPEACPLAPVGTHPSVLRPAILQGASAGRLEGWELIVTQNLSRYDFDPNDQQAGVVPETRHIAVYERPGGERYRIGIDRWRSVSRARTALARDGPWGIVVPWGTYTMWVEWGSGEDGRPTAERLLAEVTTADGVRLGGECVTALLAESGGGGEATAAGGEG